MEDSRTGSGSIEWGGTAIHENPRGSEDDAEDGHANEDVLLVAAVEIVFHPRSEPSSSPVNTPAAAAAFGSHFLPLRVYDCCFLRFWSVCAWVSFSILLALDDYCLMGSICWL